ncbi:hypothetical protein DEO72_LG10g2329 [Vigna unguiculata]|uniref:Uncharacterized protein n=1 Tax=Vigna unguiculata TaxID=3917 RepID=A0A4D6NBN3_VIGUN|nr:hypothetical protein DEO72_LG10g2329 [Vigna unguiculata]
MLTLTAAENTKPPCLIPLMVAPPSKRSPIAAVGVRAYINHHGAPSCRLLCAFRGHHHDSTTFANLHLTEATSNHQQAPYQCAPAPATSTIRATPLQFRNADPPPFFKNSRGISLFGVSAATAAIL